MSKKAVNYGNDYVSKGVAYIRHHIADRMISDKIITSRNDFNDIFWNPFRNSNYRNFWSYLQDKLTSKQFLDICSNDKRQVLWICGITPQIKTSSLVVMKKDVYTRLDSLTAADTYYAGYSSSMVKTSSNDIFIGITLPKI